jgi:hypothetical protein
MAQISLFCWGPSLQAREIADGFVDTITETVVGLPRTTVA